MLMWDFFSEAKGVGFFLRFFLWEEEEEEVDCQTDLTSYIKRTSKTFS